MKSMVKRTGAMLAIAAYATTVLAGFGIAGITAHADSDAKEGLTYYYNNLFANPRAERFYKTFETLEKEGAFKKNEVDYNLVENNVVVGTDVENYVENGSATLPIAYGAARDSYLMDHPDLFYADIFGVSVSAGVQNGNYVAYLDTSRTDSLYIGYLDSEAKIDQAIVEYENVLSTIVKGAKAAGGVKEQIEYVNRYMIDHTEYSFCPVIEDGEAGFLPEADYIDTSYGALVNGKAICGGYAKGFKAVMDRLEIPCVCVQGYSRSSATSALNAHMWNAVKLDGMWYGVDVTWNDTANHPNGWLLVGENTLERDHVEDNVVSSSGYELKYPALKPYDYGKDTDANGMEIKGEYRSDEGYGKQLVLTVIYDGMGASQLANRGTYLAFRLGDAGKDGNIAWGKWGEVTAYSKLASGFVNCEYEDKTLFYIAPNIEYIQFALIDHAPDEPHYINGHPSFDPVTGELFCCEYSQEKLTPDQIGGISSPYQNEGFGSYIPAPAATGVTPSNTGSQDVKKTYTMKFVYSDKLVLMEGKHKEDVKLNITTSRGNDTVNENVEVSDFVWDGDRTITFTFKPSQMYIHNLAVYSFTPTNLIGERSSKIPEAVTFTFKGKSVVCSKIFNDGRLYMNVFGEPKMLDATDLSVNNFQDADGNYYAKDQRSQLLLVADKPGNAKSEEMKDVLQSGTGLGESDIVTTATYEISLQICGVVQKVPNGSYMQVAFGFPEGFSPDDDAGTTFKIYHYEHDDKGNITGVTEVPVIITEFGIIAQVKSFSPFALVQVKKSAVAESAAKNIYASVIGKGGSLCAENGKSGIAEVTGDSITYTINADEGYEVGAIMLNGKALGADRYQNGTITLSKSELAEGNTLEATFVTAKSAESYRAKGVEIKHPDRIVVTKEEILNSFTGSPASSNTTAIVIGCVSAVVVAAAGAAVCIVVLKKRGAKTAEASVGAGGGQAAKKSGAKKKSGVSAQKGGAVKKTASGTSSRTAEQTPSYKAKKPAETQKSRQSAEKSAEVKKSAESKPASAKKPTESASKSAGAKKPTDGAKKK